MRNFQPESSRVEPNLNRITHKILYLFNFLSEKLKNCILSFSCFLVETLRLRKNTRNKIW